MSAAEQLYRVADELRAVACLSGDFAKSRYDEESYERLLAASARLIATLKQRFPDQVLMQFRDNTLHVSPLAGAEAAVPCDGALTRIRCEDDDLWALQGGLTEVGETLAEWAQRELREEAGVCGTVTWLPGILDSRSWRGHTNAEMYHAVFLADGKDGPAKPGLELTDPAFFREDRLTLLSPGHHLRVPFVFKQMRGEAPVPYFDGTDALSPLSDVLLC